jgi:DNA-binding transcriptional ArsR family regulator
MTNACSSVAEVAAVIGSPARANVLAALLDGRSLTAKELAHAAGVSPQTTSGHLAKLTEARLLVATKQGRHSYFRLASPRVANMLESILAVAAEGPPRYQPRWRGGDMLRLARTCYDHLAGQVAVAMTDALVRGDFIALAPDGGVVTAAGERFLAEFGIDVRTIGGSRRAFCRPCLDWSERRPHLAGAVGAALASRCFALGWIDRVRDTRAVRISPTGRGGFAETFGIDTETLFATVEV